LTLSLRLFKYNILNKIVFFGIIIIIIIIIIIMIMI